MAVGDEDVTVLPDHDVSWRVEMVSPSPGLSGGSEAQQQLASRAELDRLVPPGAFGGALLGDRIGHPDVAISIYIDAMRPDDRSASEAIDGVPIHVELHDRIEVRVQALVAEPLHGRRIAANHRPEVPAVRVHLQIPSRTHRPAGR